MVKILFKCEHCASYYKCKSRALECAKDDLKNHHGFKPIITKYIGEMKRIK